MYCSAPPTLMRLLAQPDGATGLRLDSPAARNGRTDWPEAREIESSTSAPAPEHAASRPWGSWAAKIGAAALTAFSARSGAKANNACCPPPWYTDES